MKLRVIPNSSKEELVGDKLYLKAVASKGKANAALIKFFKKRGMKVEIIKGKKSRDKVLKVNL